MTDATTADTPVDPYDLDFVDLQDLFTELNEPSYRAKQVWEWLIRGVDDPESMTNLPAGLREKLTERFGPTRPELVAHTVADERHTHKFLLRFADGTTIESVLMLYPERATVCVSSQAGCAFGCPFCATGQAGLQRNLTRGEILRQIMVADAALREGLLGEESLPDDTSHDHVTNVVFMGMGEPLANAKRVIDAVNWLTDENGRNMASRHITVSTVGLVPGMHKVIDELPQVGLALSLHAANDRLRDELVPINRTHNLAELRETLQRHREVTGRRSTIEWCLIGHVNDDDTDADQLAKFAKDVQAHVNVIPLNPTPGSKWKEPSGNRIHHFMDRLRSRGCNATLRDTRGRDADAACGQLLATYTLGSGSRLPAAVAAEQRVEELLRNDLPITSEPEQTT